MKILFITVLLLLALCTACQETLEEHPDLRIKAETYKGKTWKVVKANPESHGTRGSLVLEDPQTKTRALMEICGEKQRVLVEGDLVNFKLKEKGNSWSYACYLDAEIIK